ncbi:hypothetical protein [Pleionea litopenaei]|uniref:Uncharacterized protein n=1 Tax=Pleionea litopenaei TaxID=3070815 RepID=A0AA51RQA2_9GAMM|nr:hypothetical protein [Pleionea sp. HL-JVS1]WMS85626.1 hypothetical protein Q9312_10415 [Pleionea sp. HL-JVS1]
MANRNDLVNFLRHYGPIPASDNMYDELIQSEVARHSIDPVIHIEPARLSEVITNFEQDKPNSIILTGTAGDGKTYHCRRVWEHFGGDVNEWQQGKKIAGIELENSSIQLVIIKDLSELTEDEKAHWIPLVSASLTGENTEQVFLIAANDGQLLASWRGWAEAMGGNAINIFKTIENMLVENIASSEGLQVNLFNLSRLDASKHFDDLIEQIVEHPLWDQCQREDLLNEDGELKCPIEINRQLLRNTNGNSLFRCRIIALLKLASANRMHLPIRDLLLLCVNIILGDRKQNRILLTCTTAKNRANRDEFRFTNPYANVFGANLKPRHRLQYQIFTVLESFGIGRETDNKFDNLLIYGKYDGAGKYKDFVASDQYYGARAYENFLTDYLEGERSKTDEFMQALSRQRQRLFFSLPGGHGLDHWNLTVYRSSGDFLAFTESLRNNSEITSTSEILVRGLNRTFCGMMMDDSTVLHLASSGGDGRGRIASILCHDVPVNKSRRDPYLKFAISNDDSVPSIRIIDPADKDSEYLDSLDLQLTHFEYLVRVANGSLPASFSRQCHEDFLDFKLRLIKRLDDVFGRDASADEVNLEAITVDERGRAQSEDIRIRISAQ